MPKEIWLDPTSEEAQAAQGCLTLSFVPALNLVTNIWQTGRMSIDEVEKVNAKCELSRWHILNVARIKTVHRCLSRTLPRETTTLRLATANAPPWSA